MNNGNIPDPYDNVKYFKRYKSKYMKEQQKYKWKALFLFIGFIIFLIVGTIETGITIYNQINLYHDQKYVEKNYNRTIGTITLVWPTVHESYYITSYNGHDYKIKVNANTVYYSYFLNDKEYKGESLTKEDVDNGMQGQPIDLYINPEDVSISYSYLDIQPTSTKISIIIHIFKMKILCCIDILMIRYILITGKAKRTKTI